MPANVDAMVREGVNAFKEGKKDDARAFLMKAVEIDQYNEQAWLWLSAVVDTIEDQRTCLENVLAINPHNERARAGLQIITQQLASPPTPDLTASSSLDMNDYFPTTPAPVQNGGSAPTPRNGTGPLEPTKTDYDEWMTGLNLAQGAPAKPAAPPKTAAPTPSKPPTGSLNAQPQNPFGADVFGAAGANGLANGLGTSPFSSDDFEDVFTPPGVSVPPAAPKVATPPAPAAPPPTPRAAVMSPGREKVDFDEPFSAGIETSGRFVEFEDNYDDDDLGELNADELFGYIPEEIRPTRLPGTNEGYPALVMVGLVVLILLNVAAAALLIYRWSPA
jgi:hypothetical protein